MPQEMRSRFWYVLLERPDLAQQLMVRLLLVQAVLQGGVAAALLATKQRFAMIIQQVPISQSIWAG